MTVNKNGAKVGDILESSWGYDQTNVDYFEVVAVTKASVRILPMTSVVTASQKTSESVVPGEVITSKEVNEWIRNDDGTHRMAKVGTVPVEPVLKRTNEGYRPGGYSVRMNSFSNAYLWDGEANYQTAHGFGH